MLIGILELSPARDSKPYTYIKVPDPNLSVSVSYLLGLLGEEFSIGPLGPLRECR